MMCFPQRSFNKVSVPLYNHSRENARALEIQRASMLKLQATRLIPTVLDLGIAQNLWHKLQRQYVQEARVGCPLDHKWREWMPWWWGQWDNAGLVPALPPWDIQLSLSAKAMAQKQMEKNHMDLPSSFCFHLSTNRDASLWEAHIWFISLLTDCSPGLPCQGRA